MIDRSSSQDSLIIGTRKSLLAQEQTRLAIAFLKQSHYFQGKSIHVQMITTSGDKIKEGPLYSVGGKGLFVKELEESLLQKRIDIAVHSLKDVESFSPAGLTLAAYLPRGPVEDVLLSARGCSLQELPVASRVGTVSPRRKAQLLHVRQDIQIIPLRGNVQSRLEKLTQGKMDAIVLAYAGLERLHLHHDPRLCVLPISQMLPAVGQGAIVLQCRQEDEQLFYHLQALSDGKTALCVAAERTFLAALGGSCRTPIAGLATLDESLTVTLRGMIAPTETSSPIYAHCQGQDPLQTGQELADKLLQSKALS